jgi:ABC-type lipoprotein export system ATPase subunit
LAKAPKMNATAVRCEGLVHIYRSAATEVVALRDVDLVVEDGETVALLGPSGAGKTTLLWLLAGLMRPSGGQLWLHGREISRLPLRQLDRLRATHIGVVLQNPARNLLPHASAAQNIAFAQRAGPARHRERRRRIGELLEAVGLLEMANAVAGRLSGGEQQRLAVGVALANWPRLVLADEPTSQLDGISARQVVELLSEAPARFGATVVVVTHDPEVSQAFDRMVTIRDGRVGAEGRSGREYIVIGRDGTVQLPPELHDLLPPGGLARVVPTPDGVRLFRVDPERESP